MVGVVKRVKDDEGEFCASQTRARHMKSTSDRT